MECFTCLEIKSGRTRRSFNMRTLLVTCAAQPGKSTIDKDTEMGQEEEAGRYGRVC